MARLGIIGGGSWGTALACVARRSGSETILWAREPEVADAINAGRGNPLFLPGAELESGIAATTDIAEAVEGIDAAFLVAPAQHLRAVASSMVSSISSDVPVVICAKGIEQESCALMSEVIAEELPRSPIVVLSGPTFAAEVVGNLPTAVTLADRTCTDWGADCCSDRNPTISPLLVERPGRSANRWRAQERSGNRLRHRRWTSAWR